MAPTPDSGGFSFWVGTQDGLSGISFLDRDQWHYPWDSKESLREVGVLAGLHEKPSWGFITFYKLLGITYTNMHSLKHVSQ